MPTKIDFLLAKVSAFEQTLEKLDNKSKANGLITIDLGQNFNTLLDQIKAESPEAAPELPAPINLSSKFAMLGQTSTSYAALEIMVKQVANILGVLKAGH